MRIISASLDSGPSGSVLYLEFSFPVRHRECGGIGGREEMVGCPSLGLMGDETSPIRLSLSAKSVFGPHSHCSCLGTFQIFICPCFFFFPHVQFIMPSAFLAVVCCHAGESRQIASYRNVPATMSGVNGPLETVYGMLVNPLYPLSHPPPSRHCCIWGPCVMGPCPPSWTRNFEIPANLPLLFATL